MPPESGLTCRAGRGAALAVVALVALSGCTTTHIKRPKGWSGAVASVPLPRLRVAVEELPCECKSRFRDHSAAEALGGVLAATTVMLDHASSVGLLPQNEIAMKADLEAWHTDQVFRLDRSGPLPDDALLEPVFCQREMGRLFVESTRVLLKSILAGDEAPDALLRIQVMRHDVAKSWTGGKAFSVASLPVGIGLFFLGLWADHIEHTVELRVELLDFADATPLLRRSYLVTVEGAISDMVDEDVHDDMERMIGFVLGSFFNQLAPDVSDALFRKREGND